VAGFTEPTPGKITTEMMAEIKADVAGINARGVNCSEASFVRACIALSRSSLVERPGLIALLEQGVLARRRLLVSDSEELGQK
jgi:hypothetical protein